MSDRTDALARDRARYLTGVIWHVGAFVIVNGLFWVLDLITGQGGVQWAFWITLFWGFALAFHVLAFFVAGRQLEERFTNKYAEEYRSAADHRHGADA